MTRRRARRRSAIVRSWANLARNPCQAAPAEAGAIYFECVLRNVHTATTTNRAARRPRTLNTTLNPAKTSNPDSWYCTFRRLRTCVRRESGLRWGSLVGHIHRACPAIQSRRPRRALHARRLAGEVPPWRAPSSVNTLNRSLSLPASISPHVQ